jgi:hypothetical protein
MALLFACILFLSMGAVTFHPAMKLLYARNPAFMGMLLTLCACFLGVYGAIEFSRLSEREDRMARAATLMDMAKESLTADRAQAHLSQLQPPGTAADSVPESRGEGPNADGPNPDGAKPGGASPKELGELLRNGAVLEQISPPSLKALLASQAEMRRELRDLSASKGRERRHHLNGYLRELSFAQGVLAAEAEFQRGNIGRGDLEDILREWSLKKESPAG